VIDSSWAPVAHIWLTLCDLSTIQAKSPYKKWFLRKRLEAKLNIEILIQD
jgi:hypothetical protein